MDYMIVDISELEENEIKVGDFVELIGNNILLGIIAKKSKTIPYEILNNIGNRVKKFILRINELVLSQFYEYYF